jgi:hypothetical protein
MWSKMGENMGAARFPAFVLCVVLVGPAVAVPLQEKSAAPTAEQVGGALYWNAGKPCRDLIDACLDEHGNELVSLPEFSVSELKCKSQTPGRTTCSFQSAEHYGAGVVRKERCTGTFVRDATGSGWALATSGRPRWTPVLDCK